MDITPLLHSVGRIGEWADLPFFENGGFSTVCTRLIMERRPVLPEAGSIFRALELTKKQNVRVVILGQDPYPNPQYATGLAFAIPDYVQPHKIPPSLEHIFNEVGTPRSTNKDLVHWANQGVLLLNTTLTIPVDVTKNPPRGIALGHSRIGWRPLISQIIGCLARRRNNNNKVVFMCLGAKTHRAVPQNLPAAQKILTCHPAYSHIHTRTSHPRITCFNGSRAFVRANNFLQTRRIIW